MSEVATNLAGDSFLSYRRTRADEAELLIAAQNERGIPTWQDITDLGNKPTTDELRRVLASDGVANVLLWVTPDVAESAVILKVEIPAMMKRREEGGGFFIVPVAAGGLDYGAAAKVASTELGLADLDGWNWEKVEEDPIGPDLAAAIARRILAQRVRAIDQAADAGEPFTLTLDTWGRSPARPRLSFHVDWSRHFTGRFAEPSAWSNTLIPAMNDLVTAISDQNRGREVVAQGQASICAAFALGFAFREPTGISLTWMQNMRAAEGLEKWSLSVAREESPVVTRYVERDPNADSLFVAVGFTGSSEAAIKTGLESGSLPPCRACVFVEGSEGEVRFESPGQVVDAVEKTVTGIKEAKDIYKTRGVIHLFVAAPAGFAVLLGQKSNALGPLQVYEHEHDAAEGERYLRAALLTS